MASEGTRMIDRIAQRAFRIGAAVFAVASIAVFVEGFDEPIFFALSGIFGALAYLSAKAGGLELE